MPKNPNNSTIIQAVLDIMAAADPIKHKDLLAELSRVTDALTNDRRLQHDADQKFHGHLYPDKSLTFAKTSLYNDCPERFQLSAEAQVIMGLFERTASQEGLVRIPQGVIAAHFRMGRATIRKAIDELVRYQFVVVYEKPPRGSKTPITYLIDKQVTCSGKDPTIAEISTFSKLKQAGPGRKKLSASVSYQQAILSVKRDDGTLIKIGTLIERELPQSESSNSGDSPLNDQTQYIMGKSRPSIPEGIPGQMCIYDYPGVDPEIDNAFKEVSGE